MFLPQRSILLRTKAGIKSARTELARESVQFEYAGEHFAAVTKA